MRGLTRTGPDLQLEPAAAESWAFDATGTVLTLTLRPDLRYSDGSPIAAQDFAYSLRRMADPRSAGPYQHIIFDIVGAAELAGTPPTDTVRLEQALASFGAVAHDERTLVIHLRQPAPHFPSVLSLSLAAPLKQSVIEQGGEDWWRSPQNHVGNGPFILSEASLDQRLTFRPNPHYRAGTPRLASIELVVIPDPSVALETYRAGQLEVMSLDPSQVPAIQRDAQLSQEFISYPLAGTWFLVFNLTKEPFTDQKVREAFAYATDREQLCQNLLNGVCRATQSFILEELPGGYREARFAFDPEQGQQTLRESRYGNASLPPIALTYISDTPADRPLAEWMAGQYRSLLGVDVQLDPIESRAFYASLQSPTTFPHMTMLGFGTPYLDPQGWFEPAWRCHAIFAQGLGFCDQELDQLLERANREMDAEQRMALYREAGALLVAAAPAVFLYNPATAFLVRPDVRGYQPTQLDYLWPGEVGGSLLTLTVER